MSDFVRCLVGDVNGRIIGELSAELGPISWRLNEVGRAEFSVARTDSKADEDHLGFGNRIAFQFENGLPDWAGVIDTPRSWTAEGRIQCTAYSGEYILGWRRTGKDRKFSGVPVGSIYKALIQDANGVANTGIAVGNVWTGGDNFTVEYHYDNLLEVVQDLLTARLRDCDFYIAPAVASGRISFLAHFYSRRGSSKTSVALIEGHNAVGIELSEQGPIVNVFRALGGGSTWGDERTVGEDQDDDSIANYGRREESETHSDITQQTALDGIAGTLVDTYKDPANVLSMEAVNLAPATFASYNVGDSVRVWLHSYGFSGYNQMVRVLAREYDPVSGRCQLVTVED